MFTVALADAKMAPPEAVPLVARFALKLVLKMVSGPPKVKTPPPPVVPPVASFVSILTPLMVISPIPFHNPPPSKAVLF